MGCSESKTVDLPLVVRCRERRKLIKAAANYRYAFAAAHLAYFLSLKDVGDALRRFVQEDLVSASLSSSDSSPTLKKNKGNADELHLQGSDDGSHLHLSVSSDDDSEDYDHNHHALDSDDDPHQHRNSHMHEPQGKDFNNEIGDHGEYFSYAAFNGYNGSFGDGMMYDPFMYSYPKRSFADTHPGVQPPVEPLYYSRNSNVYYMKKPAPEIKTVVQQLPPEQPFSFSGSYWNSTADYGNDAYRSNDGYFSRGSPLKAMDNDRVKVMPNNEVPLPPSPKVSSWDFFNPFDMSDNVYTGYSLSGGYDHLSNTSSADSSELRKREGIPDLEEDTENELSERSVRGNRIKSEVVKSPQVSRAGLVQKNRDSRSEQLHETRSTSLHKRVASLNSVPSWTSNESEKLTPLRHRHKSQNNELVKPASLPLPLPKKVVSWVDQSSSDSISLSDGRSSPEILAPKNVDEKSMKGSGVSFGVAESSNQDTNSSKLSNVTLLSPHGSRNLKEVVAEIRGDFEIASTFGKEVAMMLEVGKLPHQSSFLRATLSRIICHLAPSLSRDPLSIQSFKLASRNMKLAESYFEDVGKDVTVNTCSLSLMLDKLYAWEKKLYKEVKDEEKLRVKYEKQIKMLITLDEGGAEPSKLDAAQTSIRKLQTKLDVSIKTINVISSRIHKLRDEELQPQIAVLIHGLIRMWKSMLKCHQKQFQAIMDSKMQKLKVNIHLQSDATSSATIELERVLCHWCNSFVEWIVFQKSYADSLNGWLLRCLQYEAEESPDGPVPYSPGKLGAPPIFTICNDWHQAMAAISEVRVANVMSNFAKGLRLLGEKQNEEGRQRLKAEFLTKDYEKHFRRQPKNRRKLEHDQDNMSEKTGLSLILSDNGVSPLDDLKVNLDSMRQRLNEERMKHKNIVKSVHDAASSSLRGGLVPIFKSLEKFTDEALKLHEHVRLMHPEQNATSF